jgi:acyl-CoA synthetase (AMP-forming)/AMP-acid ligase II
MMLDQSRSGTERGSGRTTFDRIFRLAAAGHPQRLALCDPPNRAAFTDGAPRRLTWAQADMAVGALAQRLRETGLPPESVVAFQLPNIVESVITLLAILRAGMIAAPLPLLWRRADCVPALSRAGAKAVITCSRVGETNHGEIAIQVASALFPIRHVWAFGATLPEGVVPLDDIFSEAAAAVPVAEAEPERAAGQTAVVTFEATIDGHVPVARNHVELFAASLPCLVDGGLSPNGTTLSLTPVSSFGGIALTVGAWLLGGGTLALHHAFDPPALSMQLDELRCDHVILPGAFAARLAEAGLLSPTRGLKSVLAMWRTPERLAMAAQWPLADVTLTDVSVFGEIALITARRADGLPVPFVPGQQTAPYRSPDGIAVADLTRTAHGTLAVRGPMVPHQEAFPPGAAHACEALKPDQAGFIDTGFTCRIDSAAGALIVTGPPMGLVTVGGYRFALADLEAEAERVDAQASVAAFPDAFAGQRLAGSATDQDGMRRALTDAGVNPLFVRAFRDREALPA